MDTLDPIKTPNVIGRMRTHTSGIEPVTALVKRHGPDVQSSHPGVKIAFGVRRGKGFVREIPGFYSEILFSGQEYLNSPRYHCSWAGGPVWGDRFCLIRTL